MKRIPYQRADRVADQLFQVVAALFTEDAEDPRLKGVRITSVKLTRDMQLARIYYFIDGDEERRNACLKGLDSASGFIKREIAHKVALRFMPTLKFFFDDSIEYGEHIDDLLNKIGTVENDDV